MTRGRPPIPTSIKALRGNPGKRALNANEPRPTPGRPSCPSWLNLEAKREWGRVVPELDAVGLLAQVDRAALAAYCQAWARYVAAEAVIERCGLSVELSRETATGQVIVYQVIQRPEVAISQKERQLMRAYLTEFGLTPASRTRLKAPEKAPVDEFEEFVSGRRG